MLSRWYFNHLFKYIENEKKTKTLFRTFIQHTYRQRIMSDDEETWNVSDAMNKIRAALDENNQSVEDLFASIDGDDDGQINGPELYKGLQSVVGDKLSPNQVSMIIKALDTNEDNRIDLGELQSGLSSEEE